MICIVFAMASCSWYKEKLARLAKWRGKFDSTAWLKTSSVSWPLKSMVPSEHYLFYLVMRFSYLLYRLNCGKCYCPQYLKEESNKWAWDQNPPPVNDCLKYISSSVSQMWLIVRSTTTLTYDEHSTWPNPILEILFCFFIINDKLGIIRA